MKTSVFEIVAKHRLGQIVKIQMRPLAGDGLDHAPGQYLYIQFADGRRRPYSIANAPQPDGGLELHVRHVPGGDFSEHLSESLGVGHQLTVQGPHGRLVPNPDSELPVLLVAGGTGFAPLRAITEAMLIASPAREIVFYWGARTREDLYDQETIGRWASRHPGFRFVPVLSEEDCAGMRHGLAHEFLLSDLPELSGHELYVAGPRPMVEAVAMRALSAGLLPEHLFHERDDAGDPAPCNPPGTTHRTPAAAMGTA